MKKIIALLFLATTLSLVFSCTKDAGKTMGPSTGKGGSLARFTIVGQYLYIVDKSHLKVFDISIASKPVLKNTTEVGFEIETIFPFKDKLFIGSTSVVHIFSIEDPARPQKLSTAISPEVIRRCDPVVAKDSVAYATLRTNGACGGAQSILAVYDIKNVMQPVQVNNYPLTEPYGLGYYENALYVCDINSILVFDISDPYSPRMAGQLEWESCYDVIATNNLLVCWTKTGMTIYDISQALQPRLITKIS